MKHTLILFLMAFYISLSTFADGKFYAVSGISTTLEYVKDNKLNTLDFVVKQTYDCKTNLYSIVNTTNESIIAFSTDVIVKLNDNSKLNIDSFEQLFNNIKSFPSILNYTTTNFNLTLFGSAQFDVKTTFTEENPMIISTSMATIVVKTGKFIIRSEDKSLLLIVLDGEVNVLDVISTRQQIVKEKNMLVVVPAPKLQGRAAENFKKQNVFSLKSLDENDFKEFTMEFSTLDAIQSDIKFIVVNGDVFGVKIH